MAIIVKCGHISIQKQLSLLVIIACVTGNEGLSIAKKTLPAPVYVYPGGYGIYPLYGGNMTSYLTRGSRVIKGDDWNRGNEGRGGPGTIINVLAAQQLVDVQWDSGEILSYRAGYGGMYDLYLLANENDCKYLIPPDYSYIVYTNGTFIGSQALILCFEGFALVSLRDRTCEINGRWSGQPSSCESLMSPVGRCGGHIDVVANGSVVSPGYPYYYPTGTHCYWILTVPSGSVWFNVTAQLPCDGLDYLLVQGTKYSCNTIESSCFITGTLFVVEFHSNGFRRHTGFKLDYTPGCQVGKDINYVATSSDVFLFSCPYGELFGDAVLKCMNNLTWNGTMPYCQRHDRIELNTTSTVRTDAFCNVTAFAQEGLYIGILMDTYYYDDGYVEIRDGASEGGNVVARLIMGDGYYRQMSAGNVASLTPVLAPTNKNPEVSVSLSAGCPYLPIPIQHLEYTDLTLFGSIVTCKYGSPTSASESAECLETGRWSDNLICNVCGGTRSVHEGFINLFEETLAFIDECEWIILAAPGQKVSLKISFIGMQTFKIYDVLNDEDFLAESIVLNDGSAMYILSNHAARINVKPSAFHLQSSLSIYAGCTFIRVVNGTTFYTNYTRLGSVARISCDPGFSLKGSPSVVCGDNWTWLGEIPQCEPYCRELHLANGHVTYTNQTYIDSVATFVCLDGFTLVGDAMATCIEGGVWSSALPACDHSGCGEEPTGNFEAVVLSNGTEIGSSASFMCPNGFILFGEATIECLPNKTWSATLPECIAACGGVIKDQTSGYITAAGYPFDIGLLDGECTWIIVAPDQHIIIVDIYKSGGFSSSITTVYTGRSRDKKLHPISNNGFRFISTYSEVRISTRETGIQIAFVIEQACPDVNAPTNGNVERLFKSRSEVAVFSCDQDYVLIGSPQLTCLSNHTWDASPPICFYTGCNVRLMSDVKSEAFFISDTINYNFTCDRLDFFLINNQTMTCQNGSMVGRLPYCRRIVCDMSPPTNGHISRIETSVEGFIVSYTCNEGYVLVGSPTRLCLHSNVWQGDSPRCTNSTCWPLELLGGSVLYTSNHIGAVAIVICNEGLTPSRQNITCQDNRQWTEVTCSHYVCETNESYCVDIKCTCIKTNIHNKEDIMCDYVPLYPFGVAVADIELGNVGDVCSTPIHVPYGIPVNGQIHESVFVCSNGLVSLTQPFLSPSPPRNISQLGSHYIIAPFFVDIDSQLNGNTFFHVYNAADITGVDSEVVTNIELLLQTYAITKTSFKSSFILVATWSDVQPFEKVFNKSKKATFQLVLATDGFQSYAMYIYGHGQMTWALNEEDDPHVWVGYWAGEGFQWTHPYSFLSEVLKMDKHAQHTDIQGLLIHSLTPQTVENPEASCGKWYDNNKHKKDVINKAEKTLPQCPCNIESLRLDPSALFGEPVTPDDGDIMCVDLVHVNRHGAHGKSCCYNISTALWVQEQPHAGGFYQYHPKEYPKEHKNYDLYSRSYCCELSNLCHLYYDLHPVGECYKKTPFKLGASWGDPHLRTLDGKEYTFNGLGEYLLLQLSTETSKFQLHARTEQAIKADGSLSQATVFSAFAASDGQSRIQVELNINKTALVIKANGKDLTRQFYQKNISYGTSKAVKHSSDDLTEPGMAINNRNGTIQTVFTNTGVSFTVSVAVRMLSIIVTVPTEFANKTRGLLGNYDGDPNNDFADPNGTVLSSSMTDRDVFEFGQKWSVSGGSTLFNYTDGKTHDDYANSSFVPKFLDEASNKTVAEAIEKCKGLDNIQCVYDYVFTEDEAIANATSSLDEYTNKTSAYLGSVVPSLNGCIGGPVYVRVGEKAVCRVNFTDKETTVVNFISSSNGVDLNFSRSSSTVEFLIHQNQPVTIRVSVKDKSTNLTSPEITVPVLLCTGCSGNGHCSNNPRKGSELATYFQYAACVCETEYEGDDCESNKNGCRDKPCSFNRECTDLLPEDERIQNVSHWCGDCPDGYQIGADSDKCVDINECESNNSCNQLCHNTEGSYVCSCQPGFRVKQDDNSQCKDINECEEATSNCQHICENTVGGFRCRCHEGFVLNTTTGNCSLFSPHVSCNTKNCSNTHGCTVKEKDEPTCFCNTGFVLTDDDKCEDIDECHRQGICSQGCINTAGSYKCTCHAGFGNGETEKCTGCKVPKWGKDCQRECRCTGRGAEKCHPVRGCECKKGWRGDTCDEDIDECEEQANVCSDILKICHNTPGSFKCECVAGFKADGHGRCKDIDECALFEASCEQKCTNSLGSYSCSCYGGYRQINRTHCEDIDECVDLSAGCQYKCENYQGSFNCYCPFGFVLNEDRKSCMKEGNPCLKYNNLTCDHFCIIENERAVCKCKQGFKLTPNGVCCVDIDECADVTSNGCNNGAVCVNLEGSYSCTCPMGTRLDNDQRTCIDCDDYHYGNNCESLCECAKGTCDSRYGCQCTTGWTGANCDQDVDECDDGEGTMLCTDKHNRCVNTPGSYQCQCMTGYKSINGTCFDQDECESPAMNTCEQACKNVPGSYLCSCYAGFKEVGDTCEDINECEGIHVCNQLCDNTRGSYRCSCHDGFRLNHTDRRSCISNSVCSDKDIEECTNGQCVMLGAIPSCQCKKGFHFEENSCVDIKECRQTPSPCEHVCNEEEGSFSCSCQSGYRLTVDFVSCRECEPWYFGENCRENCLCNHTNTIACNKTSGRCKCLAGWTGDSCQQDVNECDVPGVCPEHSTCNNADGSYFCRCLTGFQKTARGNCSECGQFKYGNACHETCQCVQGKTISCDHKNGSCHCMQGWKGAHCSQNVDECNDSVTTCPQDSVCEDTEGSYNCRCSPGYMKINDTCKDINECLENACNDKNCTNTKGSYECNCWSGFTGDYRNCKACTDNTFGFNCSMRCDCNHTHTVESSQSCDRVTGECLCNQFWSGRRCEVDVDECLIKGACDQYPFTSCRNLLGTFTCDCVKLYIKDVRTGACIQGRSTIYILIRLSVDTRNIDINDQDVYRGLEKKVNQSLYAYFKSKLGDFNLGVMDMRIGSLIVNVSLTYNNTEQNIIALTELLSALNSNRTITFDNASTLATLEESFNDACEIRSRLLMDPCTDGYTCTMDSNQTVCRLTSNNDKTPLMIGVGAVIGALIVIACAIIVCIVLRRRRISRKQKQQTRSRRYDGFKPKSNPAHKRMEHSAHRGHRRQNKPVEYSRPLVNRDILHYQQPGNDNFVTSNSGRIFDMDTRGLLWRPYVWNFDSKERMNPFRDRSGGQPSKQRIREMEDCQSCYCNQRLDDGSQTVKLREKGCNVINSASVARCDNITTIPGQEVHVNYRKTFCHPNVIKRDATISSPTEKIFK